MNKVSGTRRVPRGIQSELLVTQVTNTCKDLSKELIQTERMGQQIMHMSVGNGLFEPLTYIGLEGSMHVREELLHEVLIG